MLKPHCQASFLPLQRKGGLAKHLLSCHPQEGVWQPGKGEKEEREERKEIKAKPK